MLDYAAIGKRIREAREHLGLSQTQLADALGYTYVAVSGWETGRRRPSLDDLLQISKILNKPLEYFIGERSRSESPVLELERIVGRTIADVIGVVYVPIVGTIPAGRPILAVENIEGYLPFPKDLHNRPDFALRVKGDSMIEADIDEGDLVYIRRQDSIDFSGQIAAVIVGTEEATLKRVCQDPYGEWWLVPANSKYSPQKVAKWDDVRIIGVFAGVFKLPKEGPSIIFNPPQIHDRDGGSGFDEDSILD
jgi:repressor LexA